MPRAPAMTPIDASGLRLPDLDALFQPVAEEPNLGLAVSGGPDSLALLLLAARWAAARAGPKLFVYALDHRLRPESASEVAMVAEVATRLGVAMRPLIWADAPKSPCQAEARVARYRLIGAAMRADKVGVLMTGHHRRDQAETMLMRLAHGSGPAGLAAMRPKSTVEGVGIFRPLLDQPPDLLAEIVKAAGLVPAADPTNLDPAYERVRWRQRLPMLAKIGIDQNRLARLATRLRRAEDALEMTGSGHFTRIATFGELGEVSLPLAQLLELPEEFILRVLSIAVARAGGLKPANDLSPLENLASSIRSEADFRAATLHNVRIARRSASLEFVREAGRLQVAPAPLEPGTAIFWDQRFHFRAAPEGPRFSIAPAGKLQRSLAESLVGHPLSGRGRALAAAPLVTEPDGTIAAIGTFVLSTSLTATFAGARSD